MPRTAFVDITDDGSSAFLYMIADGRVMEKAALTIKGHAPDIEGLPEEPAETYLSLPIGMLNFRVLDLPFTDPVRAREVLPFELDDLVLGGTGSVVLDARLISKDDGKGTFLAVYAEKNVLQALVEGFAKKGLDPKAVTSIELNAALSAAGEDTGGVEGIIKLLTEPRTLGAEERQGLAISELKGPFINLRRGELAYTKEAERAKRSASIAVVLVAAFCLVLSADLGVRAASVNKDSTAIKREITASYSSLFPGQKTRGYKGLLIKLRAAVKELRDKELAFSGLMPLDALDELSAVEIMETNFTEVTMDSELMVFKGEATSLGEVERIKAELRTLYPEAAITETRKSATDTILFTINARRAAR